MPLSPEQIKVAVSWWADAISNPKYDNGGEPMAGMLATLLRKPVSPTQRQGFTDSLTTYLQFVKDPDGLHVDYGPCRPLRDAMMVAGIDAHNAPWKTRMYFENGGVQVSHGYRAPEVELLLTAQEGTAK